MKLSYYILLSFSLLFLFACEKENLGSKLSTKHLVELSGTNKLLIKEFMDGSGLSDRSMNYRVIEGMLHFYSEKDARLFYDEVNRLSDKWDYDDPSNSTYNNQVLGDPALASFYTSLGFTSLSQYYDIVDMQDQYYRDNDKDYIGSPILQTLLSNKKEIAIGNKIYKMLTMNKVAVINNLSVAGLQNVRDKGFESDHQDVQFFNNNTNEYILTGGGDGVGPTGCSTGLIVEAETFVGNASNEIELNVILIAQQLAGCDKYAKIDWGDGEIDYAGFISRTTHAYNVGPEFLQNGECETFNVTVEIYNREACGGCPEGLIITRSIDVTICFEMDECVDDLGQNVKYQFFNQNGSDYKLVSELGHDGTLIPIDITNNWWAQSTFYEKDGHDWDKTVPSNELAASFTGFSFAEDMCEEPGQEVTREIIQKKKEVKIEANFPVNFKFHRLTSDKRMTATCWVDHQQVETIGPFGLYD